LSALQMLDVSDTSVSDLAPLTRLPHLNNINLANSNVADLSPLTGLTRLLTLNVSKTRVTDLTPLLAFIRSGLPVKWGSASWEGTGIYVGDCPLTNPPPEIVAQGNDAILNCFAEQERGEVDHLYEAKMLILGEGGAGKTSLLRRLYQPAAELP